MKTQALKALSAPRLHSSSVSRSPDVAVHDPLWSLCARHQDNPFVRFLRAAFFYDDAERDARAHARSRARSFHDRIKPA